jgi:hypothetical protein
MLDEIIQITEQLQQMRPPPAEVWLSRYAPDRDADGNWIVCKLPVKRPYLVGFLPETEGIFVMSENVFARLASDIFIANIPVFRSGGVRVSVPLALWRAEGEMM